MVHYNIVTTPDSFFKADCTSSWPLAIVASAFVGLWKSTSTDFSDFVKWRYEGWEEGDNFLVGLCWGKEWEMVSRVIWSLAIIALVKFVNDNQILRGNSKESTNLGLKIFLLKMGRILLDMLSITLSEFHRNTTIPPEFRWDFAGMTSRHYKQTTLDEPLFRELVSSIQR